MKQRRMIFINNNLYASPSGNGGRGLKPITELARSVAAYSRVSGRLTFFATGKCSGKHDRQRPEDHDKLLERATGMVFLGEICSKVEKTP